MGQSRRYADHFDRAAADRYAAELPVMGPLTLPRDAFGPGEMVTYRPHVPVWVWLQWPTGVTTKTACLAVQGNDRVVMVNWQLNTALSRSVFVWRQAVTHRSTGA